MSPGSVPPDLADRPVDSVSGLPIPFINARDDGSHDFAAINGRRSIQCALSRICGLCGRDLEYEVAFLGDALSAETASYCQPPMHLACAEAALQLCPHLARGVDAAERGVTGGGKVLPLRPPVGDVAWVLLISNSFEIERPSQHGEDRLLIFHPGPATALRHFGVREGALVEVTQVT